VTIQEASAILKRLPAGMVLAVGTELDRGRFLEAQRLVAQALGDGLLAEAVVAAWTRWRRTGR
jgi:hypothetical protein